MNIFSNRVVRISQPISIFESEILNTQINFPCGLVKLQDSIVFSFGESDYKTIVIKMRDSELEKIMVTSIDEKYFFLSYDAAGNSII